MDAHTASGRLQREATDATGDWAGGLLEHSATKLLGRESVDWFSHRKLSGFLVALLTFSALMMAADILFVPTDKMKIVILMRPA